MAVFTEAELQYSVNPLSMLENAIYLTEEESSIQPQLIPVKENSRLQGHTVRFEDIAALAEDMDVDYVTAMLAVAESNQLDFDHLCVVVNEADIIMDPDICGELKNIVVAPVSENDLAVQYTDAVLEAYLDNQDDAFLEAGILENAFLDEFVGLNEEGEAAPEGAVQQAKNILAKAATASRIWIAKQINRLRALYNGLLAKANADVKSGNAGVFKKAAVTIGRIIDKLLAKMHNAVNTKGSMDSAYNAKDSAVLSAKIAGKNNMQANKIGDYMGDRNRRAGK